MPSINRKIAGILSVLYLLAIGGCGSPNVRDAILSPEAKNIQAWKIELAEDSTTTQADSLITNIRAELKSKYIKKEYCAPYIDAVREGLRARGYHIVKGPITEGTIRINIKGQKEHFWMIFVSDDDDLDAEQEWDSRGDPTGGHLSGEEIVVNPAKVLQTDEVRAVQLEFFDLSGKSIGQASISGGKIKPEFIAKTIDIMIKEGKY